MKRRASRALALRPAPAPSLRLLRAEGRVRALLDAVITLKRDRDALAAELAAFGARWQAEAGAAFAEREAAERMLRQARRVAEEVAALGAAAAIEPVPDDAPALDAEPPPPPRPAPARPRAFRAAAARPAAGPESLDAVLIEPEEVALKRLHRRLARALHPDRAGDDADRARLHAWMAQVNDAWHRRDLAALELLAERAGIGAPPDLPGEPERLAWLGRREAALAAARESLERALRALRTSAGFRTRAAAELRREAGGEPEREARDEARAKADALRREAMSRLDGAAAEAARLEPSRARSARIAESGIARAAVTWGDAPEPGAKARVAAEELEALAARPEPWEAALAVAAFLAEVGGRPPAALESLAAFAPRWDALRAAWSTAPDLPGALSRLPRLVEPGLRARAGRLTAGLQLASPEAVAGVKAALTRRPVAAVAREVLAACGPAARCEACGQDVLAVHLLRLRGLDEVHGLACPRCGAVLRSWWRYGPVEGLEALGPVAVATGLVEEVQVRWGRTRLALQLLPAPRAALTAARLRLLLDALLARPHALPVQPRHLRLAIGGRVLAPRARIPAGALVALAFEGAPLPDDALRALTRERIERRFRG